MDQGLVVRGCVYGDRAEADLRFVGPDIIRRAQSARHCVLLGKRVFQADVLTPKGLDDRSDGKLAPQSANEIAAEPWNADLCRFVIAGLTQSLCGVVAAVADPGDALLIAANVHKAERTYAMAIWVDAVVVLVQINEALDIEHGVELQALRTALATPIGQGVHSVQPHLFAWPATWRLWPRSATSTAYRAPGALHEAALLPFAEARRQG